MTEEEIRAVVTTARDYGFKVAAHAHGAEGIKRAIRGGVDTIEHGTFMDDEGMKLMKERGTFYVPTLSAGRWVFDQAQDPDFFPPSCAPRHCGRPADPGHVRQGLQVRREDPVRHRHRRRQTRRQRARVQAHGRRRHAADGGDPRRHLGSREFLELDDKLGSIAVGKLGELVGVPGNPLEDITVMERVVFVMKDDTVYKAP